MKTTNYKLYSELIQIFEPWDYHKNGSDVNAWSKIHPRFQNIDGCIVDLGCLGWDWSSYFFGKKRVIGVDPQEKTNESADFFKGAVHTFTGKASLIGSGIAAILSENENGEIDTLSWQDFKTKFNISKISILKVNIEGSEYELLNSFTDEDYNSIDQIAISFHDWLHPVWKSKTEYCVEKIINKNYEMIDLGIYGWKLFLKK